MTDNRATNGDESPELYVISVAAELAGMHPQTLRQYDRLGLVSPRRAKGRGRRYSSSDIHRLLQIQRLSQDEGINLAGIRKIMALRDQVRELRAALDEAQRPQREVATTTKRVFTADSTGYISARRPDVSAPTSLQLRGAWWKNLSPEMLRLVLEHPPRNHVPADKYGPPSLTDKP